MIKLFHFFRLIRLTNLLVITLTMCVIQLFLRNDHIFENTNFVWLIISTVLIAAAGNIINDYFDVKADRINKPKRLIIGKYIKRRWAMVFHWSFNSVGLLIALYVGYKLQNVWVPLIAFLSINLLWFYSAYYKRKPLIGNVIVSLLVGIVPIYVLLYNLPITNYVLPDNSYIIYTRYFIDVIVLVSALALMINLMRELVKDIQDVRGDMRLNAKTFPIKYGIKQTKLLIAVVFFITTLILIFYLYKYMAWNEVFYKKIALIADYTNWRVTENNTRFLVYGLMLLSYMFLLIGLLITLFTNKIKGYKWASVSLKLAMIFGLLTPLVM